MYPGTLSTEVSLYRGPRGEAGKSLDMPTLKEAAFITLCCAPGPKPTSSLPLSPSHHPLPTEGMVKLLGDMSPSTPAASLGKLSSRTAES